MINPGQIMRADVGDYLEVVVLSSSRFHRLSDRALIAPLAQAFGSAWEIPHNDQSIHVHRGLFVPLPKLLEPLGQISPLTLTRCLRVLVRAL